jgi:hypothetical protein
MAGLRLYQPVTRGGAVAWWLARGFAAIGGFRLLPGHPAHEVIATIAEVAPPDSAYAVAVGRRPGRSTVLVLDREGRSLALAKTATDDVGRARLAHEAEIGSRLRPALPRLLSSPRPLALGDDYVLFEFVDWIPRRDAWDLPVEVALAIGQFFRAGRRPGLDAGYTHGDLAPWNMLRTATGWSIVDWADARPDGPPFFDVLHYLVQSHALLGRPTHDDLVDGLQGHGHVGRIIAAYAEGAGLEPADVLRYLPGYLDTSERRLLPGADRTRGKLARAALRLSLDRPPS